jgi:transcriptional regulator with XRE-family HTH domain
VSPSLRHPPEPTGGRFQAFPREELRARRWSVRYLAMRSGVSHSTISRLLGGERMPSLETARRLAEALLGPAPGTELPPTVNQAPRDPIARVADALRRDPQLDRRGIDAVLRFYLSVRPASDPTSDPSPDPH